MMCGRGSGSLTDNTLNANKVRNVDVALEHLAAVTAGPVEFAIFVGIEAVNVEPASTCKAEE
jgi:hypothetical protein